MNIKSINWKHVIAHIFVALAGLSQMVHNTWTLGFYFNGEQPAIESISGIEWVWFFGWIFPALFSSFTIDIGMIVTSYEIKKRGFDGWSGAWLALTFVSLALAAYYLQWLYLANHMPALELASSFVGSDVGTALALNSAAKWILPAILPVTIILYTFSSDGQSAENMHSETAIPKITVSTLEDTKPPLLEAKSATLLQDDSYLLHFEETEPPNILYCSDCGYDTGLKDSKDSAKRALTVHQSMHCKAVKAEVQ